MTILARFNNQQVEILDVYNDPSGKIASLQATQGKPFVGGDKWPIWTEYTTAPAAELTDITPDDNKPNSATLLDLALAAARPQWPSGETAWIWRNGGKAGAFLKAYAGAVCLHLTGYDPSLRVFTLDPANGWQVARNVRADYQAWASKAQEALR